MTQHNNRKNTEKKVAFNLVVDKERCEVLHIMASALIFSATDFVMAHPKEAPRVLPLFKEFVKELAEKQHEMGWCDDPNCGWDRHKEYE